MEREMLNCPNCDMEIGFKPIEFVDVSTDPDYKEKIMNGQFFLVKCGECGAEIMVEYPVMYMDPEKKLNIYMAPDHDGELLEQLNSLDVPETDEDKDAIFRLVGSPTELLEKILLADGGRDDRIMELYKAIIVENIREDFPQVVPQDLLYYIDGDEEYLIVWDFENEDGEQLTISVEEDLYQDLYNDFIDALEIPANKYAEVDAVWLMDRVEVEE
ncbi:MAG: CpXC domain-containing protein [Firmicutes bacterium]|nr:CpXC domain-containing protein [Bacillota bacterium]